MLRSHPDNTLSDPSPRHDDIMTKSQINYEQIGDVFVNNQNGGYSQGGYFTAFDDLRNHVGIGKVTILNDTTLVFDYVRTISLEVYDSFVLTRDHTRYENI